MQRETDTSKQTIYYEMTLIAEKFPNPQKYRAAAQKFRLPYWDYYRARGDQGVTLPGVKFDNGTTSFKYDFRIPNILTAEKVMVRTPAKDALEPFDNPLVFFNFPKAGSIPEAQWKNMYLDVSDIPLETLCSSDGSSSNHCVITGYKLSERSNQAVSQSSEPCKGVEYKVESGARSKHWLYPQHDIRCRLRRLRNLCYE